MALHFKTLLTRTLSAAVFVVVLLTCITYNFISFTALFFMVSLWGLFEFYAIAEKLGAKPFRMLGFLSGVVWYLFGILMNINSLDINWISLAFVMPFLIFVAALFSPNEKPVQNVVYTIAGLIYAVLPFTLLNKIACMDNTFSGHEVIDTHYNPHIILGIILLIWANDTFAYLSGSLLGKHKLYEKISPGKTWEGTVGGAILTLASAYFIANWYSEISYMNWLAIAAIVIVFGTLGDLIESMLKRQAGIKDSGSIMPGHGGVLDRFDSLLFSSPFLYLYLDWVY